MSTLPSSALAAFAIGYAVNTFASVHLWTRAEGGVARKLLFTAAMAVPMLGAFVYGGLYTPPRRHDDNRGESHVPRGAISDVARKL